MTNELNGVLRHYPKCFIDKVRVQFSDFVYFWPFSCKLFIESFWVAFFGSLLSDFFGSLLSDFFWQPFQLVFLGGLFGPPFVSVFFVAFLVYHLTFLTSLYWLCQTRRITKKDHHRIGLKKKYIPT